ncbi:MAG: hypothetical protein R2799_05310 [Crocinitomicaceae bacterium]
MKKIFNIFLIFFIASSAYGRAFQENSNDQFRNFTNHVEEFLLLSNDSNQNIVVDIELRTIEEEEDVHKSNFPFHPTDPILVQNTYLPFWCYHKNGTLQIYPTKSKTIYQPKLYLLIEVFLI